MRKSCAAVLLLVLTALPVRAGGAEEEGTCSLGGYVRNFSLFLAPASLKRGGDVIKEPDLGSTINRLRLEVLDRLSSALSLEVEYELSALIQDPRLFQESGLFVGPSSLEYRAADFRQRLVPAPGAEARSFGLGHNLDRFVLTWKTGAADIFLGRQVVSWGSARMVNPTDVLVPFAFNEPDKEERRGVDALRVRVPLGMMDEIDLGFLAGRDLEPGKNAFFLRLKTYLFKTDVSLLTLSFRRHLLVGVDLARSLGEAGIWCEAAWVRPQAFLGEPGSQGHGGDYVRLSAGLDRNLSRVLYAFVEYHFNGAGSRRPEDSMSLLRTPAYIDGSVYLYGRHYIALGSVLQVMPLAPLSSIFLLNLNDRSLMLAPSLEINIAENIYLAAGGYLGLGRKPEHILGPLDIPPLMLHSEFGAYPDVVFTSFRAYF
ncbi:MAG: hypothetical protein JW747_05785 [Candidatus Aminicenantes bacterium]|nr:hypothetical protein [Candidatus Aminicenantes bacterium]